MAYQIGYHYCHSKWSISFVISNGITTIVILKWMSGLPNQIDYNYFHSKGDVRLVIPNTNILTLNRTPGIPIEIEVLSFLDESSHCVSIYNTAVS